MDIWGKSTQSLLERPYFFNRTLSNLTTSFLTGQPPGRGNTYWTATCKMDKAMLKSALEIFYDELAIITMAAMRSMQKRSGNLLGPEAKHPGILLATVMPWDDAADDSRTMAVNRMISATGICK
ncbi:uncharacterized protein BCR38DRAFT_486944 [Pseudomassariella vexata]|uniref:Uncharacterized protein n=1 Tax=Pseudomassariella vexata TaxID=1141098 RepID=A0A1Y2DTV4_9PEZI|nr:uncharacterized protein BCR38DRAFT_486944 [Pseudomassariella vexata]ORY62690.1 hypothetical protein BCR38DRAFT_486944 [Pseudomassariella vexata]